MYVCVYVYIHIYVQSIFSQKSRAEIEYGINVWVLCELSDCKKWGKWIIWVLWELSEFRKWGNLDSLGVVGTLGIQKMGKNE